MKMSRIIYIFIALLTLSLVGCGSSSNPASSGNVNSGLVNVNGRVNNLSGSGRVSFYTPNAAIKNGLNVTNPFRASVSNDGVYTFHTDEKGNYSGTIPSGDYYVIAENSDGSMRAVSAKQTINSARAATASATQDFTLTKTVNISGQLAKDLSVKLDSPTVVTESINAYIPVYIEGLPFVAVTDSDGGFTFNSVPVITKDSEITSYVLKASINIEGKSLTASTELTQSDFTNQTDVKLNNELVFVASTLSNSKYISGIVLPATDENDEQIPQSQEVTGVSGVIVVAILDSGKVLSSVTSSSGEFVIEVNPKDYTNGIGLTTDMETLVTARVADNPDEKNNTLYVNTSGSPTPTPSDVAGISITEAYDDVFTQSSENTLTVYGDNPVGSGIIESVSERIYQKLENYYVSNLEKGKSYCFMLVSRNYESESYGFRFSGYVNASNPFNTVTSNKLIEFSQPYIEVANNIYSVKFTKISGDDDCLTVTAYALGEHADQPIELSINDDKSINFNNLNNKVGVYKIYTVHEASYNGMKATVTSDSVPYVKR